MLQNNFTIITASAGKMLLLVGFLSFVMMVIPVYAQNQVLFVDTTAPGPIHDGMSWATAFTIIQDAIDAATLLRFLPQPGGIHRWSGTHRAS